MNLNPNQIKAIETIEKNIVVAASAGGGKTTLLINRLVKRIIKDRISLNEILAITFTEYAAINMKKRLIKALKQAYDSADNPLDKDFIQLQLSMVDNANISTIHSFCLNVIKRYHIDIQLPLTMCQNILSTEYEALYFKQAFQKTVSQLDIFNLVLHVGNDIYQLEHMQQSVQTILKIACSTLDPMSWFDSLMEKQNPETRKDIEPLFLTIYQDAIEQQLSLVSSMCDYYLHEEDPESTNVQEFRSKIQKLIQLNKQDYSSFLFALGGSFSLTNSKKTDPPGYKNLKESIKEILNDLANFCMDEKSILQSIKQNQELQKKLISFTKQVYINYQNIKLENISMDFNDIEHFAYKILMQNNGQLANEYKHQFKEIMVDEFQDTSQLQWTMIQSISKQNLFIVGDIKQSIYRFRGAKPTILNKLVKDPNFLTINIEENYRSKESIIRFNNHLFSKTLTLNNPDLTCQQIAQKVGSEKQKEDLRKVRFIPAKKEEFEHDFLLYENEGEYQVLSIINEINRLHQQNIPLKDIVVLVRNHSDKKLLKQAFEYYQIPHFIDDKSSYLNSFGVEIIISFLKLAINKQDKESLLSILLSKLYVCSLEDLLSTTNIWKLLEEEDSPFLTDYQVVSNYIQQNKLIEAISYILTIDDFYVHMLDKQEQTNVDYFIEKIESYQELSCVEILDLLESSMDYQTDISFAVSKEDDVVKVMTIHQSKGLEFDYVILYLRSNSRKHSDSIAIHEELGLGFDYHIQTRQIITDSFQKRIIQWQNDLEDKDEALRLLYVALTRPVKQLIVVSGELNEHYYNRLDYIFQRNLGYPYYIDYMAKNHSDYFDIQTQLEQYTFLDHNYSNQNKSNTILTKMESNPIEMQTSSPSQSKKSLQLNFNKSGTKIGDRLHHTMEILDFARKYTEENLLQIENELTHNQIKSILCFLNHPILQNCIKIYKEYSYYQKENGILNHGFIDLLLEKQDEVIVIDYKSDSLDKEDEFIQRYQKQLNAYREIAIKLFPYKKIGCYIYSFKLAKFIPIPITN